jgi:hypothetical protein
VILYRKGAPLRVRRYAAPEPPFWCASAVAPYGARRATPVAIDYSTLSATAAERLEVPVSDHVRDDLERARALTGPVFVEASEGAEGVFRRGEEVLAFCEERNLGTLHLVSTRGALPSRTYEPSVVAIAAWPVERKPLEALFGQARERSILWGLAVPLVYPVTTELAALHALAEKARAHGAAFLASIPVEVEATARQAIARSMNLDGEDDRYAMLFHGDVAPIHLATERHLAALAVEHGMADFILPPQWEERSNWNAAVLLTLTASRMIAMDADLNLAGLIARSARAVAELDKPVARVAEAASLSIIEALDEMSVEVLTEWIAGGSHAFVESVNEQWRLKRG